ncbi:MAG: GH92 family glycosyl hydrolase [Flavobacteriales bacterium]|nr:GH92 family glycosyl hydrolase [Flavobacteriales bacterium]
MSPFFSALRTDAVCCVLLVFAAAGCRNVTTPLSHEVDPFIGTGGHGHTYPGATVPFGMVQVSPDTRLDGWDGCGGFHITDDVVYGFSHTHLQGTGVSDYGDILLMPTVGQMDTGKVWNERYRDRFVQGSQVAHAGYYRCALDRSKVSVELTASDRVGHHRWTLEDRDTLQLIVDLAHRDELVNYGMYPLDDSTLVGQRVSDNWAEEQHVYFAMRFNRPFEWLDQLAELETAEVDGVLEQELSFVPIFSLVFKDVKSVDSRVSLSFVDIEGAVQNLNAEAPEAGGFEAAKKAAEERWNEALARIDIAEEDPEERTVFYTALYHSLTVPNLATDVDGRYRGTDLQVHTAPEGAPRYTVFSLWDTFRATHPLLNVLEPDRTEVFVQNFIGMHEEGGKLPMWELASNYTGCMIGYHAVPVIADAWAKGLHGFDADAALEAMVAVATSDDLSKPVWDSLGYLPLEKESESVSKTLEYAFDDACIAQMAEDMGRMDIAERFGRRAQGWRNLYNPSNEFLQPRYGAAWREAFDPTEVTFEYTEANGWQYNFFVPHDVSGHMELLGGPEGYAQMLDSMFNGPSRLSGRHQSDITGLIGQYAHGNEPSHHMAYLPAFAGYPERTQALVDSICDALYTAEPDGLSGNEDCGQMSSWFVWSALGLYPVTPGSDHYVIGTPRYGAFSWTLPNGNVLEVNVDRSSPDDVYVHGLTIDGVPLNRTWVDHEELMAGGQWRFDLRGEPVGPNGWGKPIESWPVEEWKLGDAAFVAAPFIDAPRSYSGDSLAVPVGTIDRDAQVWVRVVEDTPGARAVGADMKGFAPANGPVTVSGTQVVQLFAEDHGARSAVVSSRIARVNPDFSIEIREPYANQYAAGGDRALIDGIRGEGEDFRTGDWQGYYGKDAFVTVDLGQVYQVKSLSVGVLQDVKSWIWAPERVTCRTSIDGVNFSSFGSTEPALDPEDYTPLTERIEFEGNTAARFVQMELNQFNGAVIPEWHLGRFNPTWVFADEFGFEIEPVK